MALHLASTCFHYQAGRVPQLDCPVLLGHDCPVLRESFKAQPIELGRQGSLTPLEVYWRAIYH